MKPSFLRRKQVEEITGLSRSTIYAYVEAGTFPVPYKIGVRAVGWKTDEVEAWIKSRFRKSTRADK